MKLWLKLIFSLLLGLGIPLIAVSCKAVEREVPEITVRVEVPLKPKPWLGIYTQPITDAGEYGGPKGVKGIRIPLVVPDSPAEKAQLKPGDIILSYDGLTFDEIPKDKIRLAFKDYLKDKKRIGEPLTLEVFRTETILSAQSDHRLIPTPEFQPEIVTQLIEKQKPGEVLDLHLEKHQRQLTITAILGKEKHRRTTPPPANVLLFPALEDYSDDFSRLTSQLIEELELTEYYQDLMEKYEDDEWWDDGLRLTRFRYLHRDPFKLFKLSEDITSGLERLVNPQEQDFVGLIGQVAEILDEPAYPSGRGGSIEEWLSNQADLPLTPKAYLDHIVEVVQKARELRNQALDKLSSKEIDFLYQHLPGLINQLITSYYFYWDEPSAEVANYYRVINLAHQIDFSAMLQSSALLISLAEPEFLKALEEVLLSYQAPTQTAQSNVDITGDLIAITETAVGTLVIGGPGWTRYNRDYAIIIDLGGNDFYTNNAGSARAPEMPVSILIDLAGNDTYAATENFAQGSGLLGVGILIDRSGNDNYQGTRLCQAVGLMGVGLLIDLAGDDVYRGQEFNQGTVCWGAGILIDLAGNDAYYSHLFAQGVGGPKGCGLLFDIQGDDQYYATGKYKSSYGTTGIFQGSSQGFGIGFRGFASGGLGILLDSAGQDLYTAGNFSQGAGYFFGWGILKNSGQENDTYIASRYGQGASAHSAAGILIDDGGDDNYRGYMIALQGAAWDLGCAALIDKGGNDTYQARGFAQAASAHNGFALFIDHQGEDSYLYDRGPARAGGNDYHGGYSLSCFIDNGGESDHYTTTHIKNNLIMHWPEYGIFIDLDRPITESLKTESYKNLYGSK